MVEVLGNGVPGAIGQGRRALFLVLRCRGSMGRDRSAKVSAVGRRENLTAPDA
jgi:hypothetical protein